MRRSEIGRKWHLSRSTHRGTIRPSSLEMISGRCTSRRAPKTYSYRVDLWEDVNTNFGNGPPDEEYGRYNLLLNSVGSFPHLDVGIAFDSDVGEWSVGHNGANSVAPDGLEGPTFVSVAGSVIEFGLPLTLIGNPSGFTEVMAESLTTNADELDQVGRACVPAA